MNDKNALSLTVGQLLVANALLDIKTVLKYNPELLSSSGYMHNIIKEVEKNLHKALDEFKKINA